MDSTGTVLSKPYIIGGPLPTKDGLHMPKIAVILANPTRGTVALVSSARDQTGATWTPPQGPFDEASVAASARKIVAAECGISQMKFVRELFNQRGPTDRVEKKFYLWVYCITDEHSLAPNHPSIVDARWAYSRGEFDGLMAGASGSKCEMVDRALAAICERGSAHRLEW